MCVKNDAAAICPNCGKELVRARFQLEDGSWMHCWLCECPVDKIAHIAGYAERDVIHSITRVADSVQPDPDIDTPYDAFP